MSQRVPSCELEANPSPHLLPFSSSHCPQQLSMTESEYQVTELTWQNGQLSAHSLVKPVAKYPALAAGTLESVVDQAKLLRPGGPQHQLSSAAVDALVPTGGLRRRREDEMVSGIGSCNSMASSERNKRARVEGPTGGGNMDSKRIALEDTYTADDFGYGFSGSPDTENTSFGGGGGGGSRQMTAADDHDSICHSLPSQSQKDAAGDEDDKVTDGGTIVRSTISTKRSRAAVVHNQSERKRRDKINQRMRTLQKLVPNSDKTDKASMLDEVIEYLKQLQAQIQTMSRMSSINVPPVMIPMNVQPIQMAMMAQMAQMAHMAQMGMGMGMGMMDMSSLGRPGHAGISTALPAFAFFSPVAGTWDHSSERMQQPGGSTIMPDPFSTFACPMQQPMTMDAYQRMATLYQQMFQQPQTPTPK